MKYNFIINIDYVNLYQYHLHYYVSYKQKYLLINGYLVTKIRNELSANQYKGYLGIF